MSEKLPRAVPVSPGIETAGNSNNGYKDLSADKEKERRKRWRATTTCSYVGETRAQSRRIAIAFHGADKVTHVKLPNRRGYPSSLEADVNRNPRPVREPELKHDNGRSYKGGIAVLNIEVGWEAVSSRVYGVSSRAPSAGRVHRQPSFTDHVHLLENSRCA